MSKRLQRLATGQEWRPGRKGDGCRDGETDLGVMFPEEKLAFSPDLGNKLTNFHRLPAVRCRNCTSAPSWRAGVSHFKSTCPADPDTVMSLADGGSYLTGSKDGGWGGEPAYVRVIGPENFRKSAPPSPG